MNKYFIIAGFVIVLVIGVVIYLSQGRTPPSSPQSTLTPPAVEDLKVGSGAEAEKGKKVGEIPSNSTLVFEVELLVVE